MVKLLTLSAYSPLIHPFSSPWQSFFVLWAFHFFRFHSHTSILFTACYHSRVPFSVTLLFFFSFRLRLKKNQVFFFWPQCSPIPITAQFIQCTLTLHILSLSLISFKTSSSWHVSLSEFHFLSVLFAYIHNLGHFVRADALSAPNHLSHCLSSHSLSVTLSTC